MTGITAAHTVQTGIARDLASAYAFLAEPLNLPSWAQGLGQSLVPDGNNWRVSTPLGEARMRFAPLNAFGVLDHAVTLPNGDEVYVPMRVVALGEGCLVMLTVLRQPTMTDEQFQADIAAVEADLAALKTLLESAPSA
ncbi:MAG: hypothetical protein QM639_00365 [Rhodocyclaceae bacterium]